MKSDMRCGEFGSRMPGESGSDPGCTRAGERSGVASPPALDRGAGTPCSATGHPDGRMRPQVALMEHRFPEPEVAHSAPAGPKGPVKVRDRVRGRLSESALYPPRR
jgi:hypothetical protein